MQLLYLSCSGRLEPKSTHIARTELRWKKTHKKPQPLLYPCVSLNHCKLQGPLPYQTKQDTVKSSLQTSVPSRLLRASFHMLAA
jgi:hypothetical protein